VADDIFFAEPFGPNDDVGHDPWNLNQVGKGFLRPAKTGDAEPEEEGDYRKAEQEAGQIERAFPSQETPAESVYDPD
jgi:hypothetical protein